MTSVPIFDFVLTGATPILLHADDVEQADVLQAWRKAPENKGKSVAGDDRSPPWTWQTYLYHDGEYLAMPSDNIMVALRHAAAKIIMKKQQSFKSASQSGLMILDEFCDFEGPKGRVKIAALDSFKDSEFSEHARRVQDLGFRLFVKRAPVGSSKHVRVRARFDEWAVKGRIQINDSTITPVVLRQMFELAGQYAGLCDWRPSSPKSPGPYGRFTATLKESKGIKRDAA